MRIGKLLSLAPITALLVAAPASASADEGSTIIAGLSVLALTVGSDVAFTAYDIGRVRDGKTPDLAWMTAQTILTVPQAVALNGVVAAAAADEDDAALALLAVPLASWTTALATFSTWSVADERGDIAQRFGTSWLVGMNGALSSAALGAAIDERFSSPWIAIPTVAATTPSAIYSAVRASEDAGERGTWIAMTVWSGVIGTHAIVSLFDAAFSDEEDELDIVYPPEPDGAPVAVPPESDDEVIEIVPSSRRPAPTPSPLVVPSPVTDGAQVVPGLVFTGRF